MKFLLGLAAGLGIAYYFTSPKGQQILEDLGNSASDLVNKGENALKNGRITAERAARSADRFMKDQL